MAGIETVLKLHDLMSAPLRNITDALNLTISSFEALQSSSANPVSTTSLTVAKQQLTEASAQLDILSGNMNNAVQNNKKLNAETQRSAILSKALAGNYGKTAQAIAQTAQKTTQAFSKTAQRVTDLKKRITEARNVQRQFNSSVDSGSNSMKKLVTAAGSMKTVYAGIRMTTSAMTMSDTLVSIDSRLSLIGDGTMSTDEVKDQVMAAAGRSRGDYLNMMSSVSKLGLTAGDSFTDNGEIIQFVETLNKQFTIAGSSAIEASSAMYQLTQAMASGKLQSNEYSTIIEYAPQLADAIEKALGVTRGELKELSAQGAITSDVIKNALSSAEAEISKRFEKFPQRWSDIWTSLKNSSIKSFESVSKELSNLANSEEVITRVTEGLGSVIKTIFDSVGKSIAKIVVMFNEWTQNEDIVQSFRQIKNGIDAIIGTIFYLLDATVKFIGWAGKNWSWFKYVVFGVVAALFILKLALIGVQVAGMLAAAGISTAWISALWPILLVIGLIVGAIYALVKIINWMTGESVSFLGVLGATFMFFYAIIRNGVTRIYNLFTILAEYFKNVWKNPIHSVQRLFGNFVIDTLKMLSQLDITGKLSPIFDSVAESVQASIDASMPDDYEVMNKLEYVNLTDTTLRGYEFGEGLSNALSGFSSIADMAKNENDLNKLLTSSKGTETNTRIAADELSDRSLADHLRDYTQREAVNRFTTAEIKVEMNNNNSINSELDMQIIWGTLEEGLYKAIRDVKEGADSRV